MECVVGGDDAVRTYLAGIMETKLQERLMRLKICVLGAQETGKTSLVKSLMRVESDAVPMPLRGGGINLYSMTFKDGPPNNEEARYKVTLWDFASDTNGRAQHSLFFSKHTLYIVCVDLEAYNRIRAESSKLGMKEREAMVKNFVTQHVLRWIQSVFACQPEAEFVFVGTKLDKLTDHLAVKALWANLQGHLQDWKEEFTKFLPATDNRLREVHFRNWTTISSTDSQSMHAAREYLKETVRTSDRCFEMPKTHALVLDAIKERRMRARLSSRLEDRIHLSFTTVSSLRCGVLGEIDGLRADDTMPIFELLDAMGDILLFSAKDEVTETIVLDPTLASDVVGEVLRLDEYQDVRLREGIITNVRLKTSKLLGAFSDSRLRAVQELLHRLQVAYPVGQTGIIVPALWTLREDVANLPQLDKETTLLEKWAILNATYLSWEYEVPTIMGNAVFEQFAIESHPALFTRSVWSNCTESCASGEFVSRVIRCSGHDLRDVIRIEVVSGSFDTLW